MNILKSRFFKLPKHRQFDYIPIYYDADKEAREREKKKASGKYLDFSEKPLQFDRGNYYQARSRSNVIGLFDKRKSASADYTPYSRQDQLTMILMLMVLFTLPVLMAIDKLNTNIGSTFMIVTLILLVIKAKRIFNR